MALGTYTSPYIHTYSEDYQEVSFNSFNQQQFEKTIEALTQVANSLKGATDAFLGGKSWRELSDELFTQENTFRRIAREILVEREMLQSLTPRFNAKQIATDRGLSQEIVDSLSSADTLNQFAKSIVQSVFADGLQGKNLMEQVSGLATALKIDSADIAKALPEGARGFRSQKGNILQVTKKIIGQHLIDGMPSSVDASFTYFSRRFREKIKTENIVISQNGGEDAVELYLKTVYKLLKNAMKNRQTKVLSDSNTAKGILGEEFNMAVTNPELKGKGIQFSVIGDQTENEVREQYQNLFNQTNEVIPNLIKDPTKQSYSDLYLIINGRRARVQAKNAWDSLQKIIQDEDNIPTSMAVLTDQKYLSFIEKLKNSPTTIGELDDQDLKELSYAIGNAIWFSKRTDYSKEKGSYPNMSTVRAYAEQILSVGMSNYLGVVVDKKNNFKLFSDYSNLFFVVSNVIMIPTYEILYDIIEGLRQRQNSIAKLRIKFQNFGGENLTDARTFRKDKLEAIKNSSGFQKGKKAYEYPEVFKIGQQEGERIMSNLTIEKVNVNLDLSQILKTTSYLFK